MPEERERDVEVIARDAAAAVERRLPLDERVEDVGGKPEGEEQAEPLISDHGTAQAHTAS
jgi:hypothetical protein